MCARVCVFVSLCVAYHRPHYSCHYSSSFCWVWSIAPTSLRFIVLCSSLTNIYTHIHALYHSVTLSRTNISYSFIPFDIFRFLFSLVHVGVIVVVVVVVVTNVCRVLLKYHMNIKCILFSLFVEKIKVRFFFVYLFWFGPLFCYRVFLSVHFYCCQWHSGI